MAPLTGSEKPDDGEEYELVAAAEHPAYNINEPHDAAVVGWRADCFERLGFPQYLALTLALRRDVDREHVKAMVGAGATPAQVAVIVL